MAFISVFAVPASRPARRAYTSRDRRRSHATVMMASKALQALIFDCDGVLADTERDAHRVAFNVAFDENKLNTHWNEEKYGELLEVGGGKERMTAYFNDVGWPSGYDDEEARKNLVKGLHKRKTEIFGELVKEGRIPLRPGVKALAQSVFDKGLPIAVCSTSNETAVSQIVKMMGPELSESIQIFAGDVVPKKKPSPDIYNLAKEKMSLDPEATVVIEDSYIGLTAAKDAGMKCIVTKSTYTENEDFHRADLIVNDLESSHTTIDKLIEIVKG